MTNIRFLCMPLTREADAHEMVGTSEALQHVRDLIDSTGDSNANVLIMGEPGSGKEVVARGLHSRSTRRDRPFITLNCASMPETLLESELFGNLEGAFAGAHVARSGLLLDTRGGTLFLDDIDELPMTLQPKLARALTHRAVQAIGATAAVPFDVRVIAATSRDLEGEALPDVTRIDVPPLRRRGRDVLLLAQHFVEKYAARNGKSVVGVAGAAEKQLLAYHWPGNVRELENSMELAVRNTSSPLITVEDLPPRILSKIVRVTHQRDRRRVAKGSPDSLLAR